MPPAVSPASFGPREAQPLDDILGNIGQVDDVLKGLFEAPDNEQYEAMAQELNRVAAAYARFFASADGQVILEHLCDVTVRQPTFISAIGIDPMQAYADGCRREGTNALVYYIMKMIAMGRSQVPPQREGAANASL